MAKREELKQLLMDVFLLESEEFSFDLKRNEVKAWDSLGVVSLAVGIEETFGYHLSDTEAIGIKSFQDIIDILQSKGIYFDE